MTTLHFTKGHATENDFVLLFDERGDLDLTPQLVRYLCDRRAGIGGDGVIRAVRAGAVEAGADDHPDAWFMDYWNADGSSAEMCGNGARVFAAFLERETDADLVGGLTIGTRAGPRTVTALTDGNYAVGMGQFHTGTFHTGQSRAAFDAEVEAVGLTPARPAMSVNVGNPHHVVALASMAELDALDLTQAPRVTPEHPQGSNVEFVVTRGGGRKEGIERGRVRMRVVERGSGETRSCGTGAVAVAVAVREWAGPGAPDMWDVEVPGGVLTVTLTETSATLEGPAVLVATGTVDISLAQ